SCCLPGSCRSLPALHQFCPLARRPPLDLAPFPTRRSSDLLKQLELGPMQNFVYLVGDPVSRECMVVDPAWEIDTIVETVQADDRSEEHTSELQSRVDLVCRLLLEKKQQTVHHSPHRSYSQS